MQLVGMGHPALFLDEIDWQLSPGAELDLSRFVGTLRVSTPGRTAASVLLTQPGVLATQPVVPPL